MGAEAEFTAKVLSLGRITIPQATRLLLDIKEGDLVRVRILEIKRAGDVDNSTEICAEVTA